MSEKWTEEEIARTRQLLLERKSASEISLALGGRRSRNAVIGLLHRLGLAGGNSPRNRPAPIAPAVPRQRRPPRRAPEPAPALAVRPPPRDIPLPESRALPLAELEESHCKWPSGFGPYTFCGCRVEQGQIYCRAHALLARGKMRTERR